MREIIIKLRKQINLWILFFNFIALELVYGDELELDDNIIAAEALSKSDFMSSEQGYMINFNNVSIMEYIRFVSKITNKNFTLDESELQFNVTIVSEEPITLQNILSALVQVLRIHGLNFLERENNFIITKSMDVNQIPTIVSTEHPEGMNDTSPIVTRVFRVKNASPNTIAGIIRPMTSKMAMIEVSNETRQLIVTDITTNVEQISTLLASLDMPHSPLDVDSYVAKNVPPAELVALAHQIVLPFAEGNPLIFVPQLETSTIYIVSTPYLIDRAMIVMEDLDMPSKISTTTRAISNENIFIYKIQSRSPDDLQNALKQISSELKGTGGFSSGLVNAIDTMKWIEESNSILFIVDKDSLDKLKEILNDLDVGISSKSSLYLYSVKNSDREKIEDSLNQMAADLKKSKVPDAGLIQAIESKEWIKDTNSFLFTGDEDSLKKLADLMPTIDVSSSQSFPAVSQFLIYNPVNRPGSELKSSMREIASNLKKAGLADSAFLNTVEKAQWVPSSNTLLFTGDVPTLDRIRAILASLDTPEAANLTPQQKAAVNKSTFLIYKPLHQSAEQIQTDIQQIAQDLEKSGLTDAEFLVSLTSSRYADETNSLVFTGSAGAIEKVRDLLTTIDIPSPAGAPAPVSGFLLYKIQYAPASHLMHSLESIAKELNTSVADNRELADVIKHMRYVKDTNSLLFTGTQTAMAHAEELAKKFDLPGAGTAGAPVREEPATFIIYSPQHVSGPELIGILHDFEQNLINSGVQDTGLFETINTLKWIEKTCSLLVSGDQKSINKVQDLLARFDVARQVQEEEVPSIEKIANTNFLIYKLQYHQGSEIQNALKQVAASLEKANAASNQTLIDAINSLQWINITNSLIATGEQETLPRLRDLIQNLDVPLRQVFIEVLVIETGLSNIQNFGLQWGGQLQYMTKVAGQSGLFPANFSNTGGSSINNLTPNLSNISGTRFPMAAGPTPGPDIPFQPGFDLGVIGDIIMHKGRSFISLGSLVTALESDSDSNIVINPKIITQDGNNSTFFVGQNIPFGSSTVQNTGGGTTTATTANIEYRDIGFNLGITPVLGNGEIITLDITVDISQQINNTTTSVGSQNVQIQGIQTSHTNMNTRVHVPDKHFLALSGMLQDSKIHNRQGIPCLGGLPVIGAFFSQNNRTDSRSNLIMFIRPHIVNSVEEYRQITENQEALFREVAKLPILKEEIDEGIDWVKTPEDEE
ncbi:MAG TPA: secretin N-terminal domain-containing protein [Rhabdochlamydiaceae bacterium]|nr:secretin N-terminal domain-containing protein [Rhabdochlamydiaceae bacterium]